MYSISTLPPQLFHCIYQDAQNALQIAIQNNQILVADALIEAESIIDKVSEFR